METITPVPVMQKRRIDAAMCWRGMFFSALATLLMLFPAVVSTQGLLLRACLWFAVVTQACLFAYHARNLRRIRRTGPIEVEVRVIPTTPRQQRAERTIGIIAGSLLTAVTLAFSVLMVATLVMTLTNPARFGFGILGIVWLIGLMAWAANIVIWRSALRPPSTTVQVAVTPGAVLDTALTDAAPVSESIATPVAPSGPRHWWTESGTRAEVADSLSQHLNARER